MIKNYEMVIGLEVHVELKTETKIFCDCSTTFGAPPNTQCCPVCMGMPGTLPVLNQQVVDYAIKAGLATNCTIATYSKQDRKNYFYPDLPKAYQISQYDLPLCEHGYLDIENENGSKRIGITRIHIEEDAGKLVHDEKLGTMIDCNRCGVPLIEIVSEPDMRSAEEAITYLKKLRAIIIYTGVADCKMNEGGMRCDVNLSVRKKGEKVFGTRTEMKNLNSFQFILKAIEYEYKRQVEAIEAGETIVQETRRFDQASGKTFSMRKKENANDYRYFPDPDLPPIEMSKKEVVELKETIPTLPDERKAFYMQQYALSAYDAELLITDKYIADYFEQAAAFTNYPKLLANLMIGELLRMLPADCEDISVSPEHMAAIATMMGTDEINSNTAKKVLKVIFTSDQDPVNYVKQNGLAQINDRTVLSEIVTQIIAQNAKAVADYKAGKTMAIKAIVGNVMAKTEGRGNPVIINELVEKYLNK